MFLGGIGDFGMEAQRVFRARVALLATMWFATLASDLWRKLTRRSHPFPHFIQATTRRVRLG
jgi:hypothetical protein